MYEQYIGIFGGGIAGFALAAHCEKLNIPYKVIISNDDASNGYGITIQEADNIIQYLNLTPDLEKINYLNRYVKINKNEEIIFANCHSKGNYVISRSDLIALFKEYTNQENIIKIKDNETINIEETDSYVKINFNTNTNIQTDLKFKLLIGADGINSIIRDKMNIKKEDVILDTQFVLEIRELKGQYQLIRTDVVEFVSEVYKNSRLRIFIKPNGPYGATCQIVYPKSYTQADIKYLLPEGLYASFGKQLYMTNLKSTKYFVPNNLGIILLGDSFNGMIPYHGSGANTAIINAHHLAKIIKDNMETPDLIAKIFYDKIKDYTFRIVSESLNTFLEIHNPNFSKDEPKNKIYKYCEDILALPAAPNYRLNDIPINFNNNFTEIILAGADIKKFPQEFTLLENIVVLNLNDNKIDSIPIDIKLLSNLKELYLRNNNIKIFPSELNQLSNLEIIRLSYNNIKSVDISLPKIRELCLTGNELEELTSLENCKRLEKLYASENNIKSLPELFDLKRIKYFRIGFNPIKLNEIIKSFTDIQLKNIIEIRISNDQLINSELINSELINKSNIKVKYGSTLSRLNRKYFDVKQFHDVKENNIDINKIKYDIYTKIAEILLQTNTGDNDDIINFIVKLNLLKLDFENDTIKKDSSLHLIKSKINNIINSNKNNIVELLRIFTLYSTLNINDKIIDAKILYSYIKTFINPLVCDYLEKNKRFIKLKIGDKQQINEIYSVVKCMIDVNKTNYTHELNIKKHQGLPIHPTEGRPRIGHLECLYEQCGEKFTNGDRLHSHLIQTVPNFCQRYHTIHEEKIFNYGYKIPLQYENIKCPVWCCNFVGNIKEHFKQLGIQPYWSPLDYCVKPKDPNENSEDSYKIFESDICMLCLDEKAIPTLLYDCGHRALCLDCGYDLLCKSGNKDCIICRHKTKYILIA